MLFQISQCENHLRVVKMTFIDYGLIKRKERNSQFNTYLVPKLSTNKGTVDSSQIGYLYDFETYLQFIGKT